MTRILKVHDSFYALADELAKKYDLEKTSITFILAENIKNKNYTFEVHNKDKRRIEIKVKPFDFTI